MSDDTLNLLSDLCNVSVAAGDCRLQNGAKKSST